MNRLPPAIVNDWSQTKKRLLVAVGKTNIGDPAATKQLQERISELYERFDRGLGPKLKTATQEKDKEKARKALWEIIKITTEYYKETERSTRSWEFGGNLIKQALEKQLRNIKEAAYSTVRAL